MPHPFFKKSDNKPDAEIIAQDKMIEPPWVKYPGFAPGDPFWRQTGEAWLTLVWRPFWDSLSTEAQEAYLAHWRVPEDWRLYYFDAAFLKWLEDVDKE